MSEAPFTLKYDVTKDDARASFARMKAQTQPSWFRRSVACLASLWLIGSWSTHDWWFRVFLMLLVVHFWTFPRSLFWIGRAVMTFMPASMYDTTVVIEADDRGLSVRDRARPLGYRYWWSRLSQVEETDLGLDLHFDGDKGSDLEIPWKAFAGEDQRREFLDLVHKQVPGLREPAAS
ncbi:MAG: hypothetical protein KF861_07535 [Planctomycetaceae bacterium]|nr:hypothetical protein [Planctomycetaceae bacterium]